MLLLLERVAAAGAWEVPTTGRTVGQAERLPP